jgi:putative DNA primase/helicase
LTAQASARAPAMITPDSSPAELRALPRWLVWRIEIRDGKPTKIPYDAKTGKKGSSTDPGTWAQYDDAKSAFERGGYGGIGFVLGAGYTGLDLDGVRDPKTGAIEPWAAEIIAALDSYTELSPSATGVHIIVRGALPPGRRQRNGAAHTGFGLYDTGRYFTMTGARIHGGAIADRQQHLEQLHSELFRQRREPRRDSVAAIYASDAALIDRARRANDGGKFSRLWSGMWKGEYGSQSEADLALCAKLAFWTGRDAARMDGLFRQSGLMRKKWDRVDYRARTIETAIRSTSDVWMRRWVVTV